MNKQLFLDVARAIEDTGQFSLETFVESAVERAARRRNGHVPMFAQYDPSECGTTMCVCGWVNWLTLAKPGQKTMSADRFMNQGHAAEALGITMEQAERLFFAEGDSVWVKYADRYGWPHDDAGVTYWNQIQPKQAAKVLRDIAYRRVKL